MSRPVKYAGLGLQTRQSACVYLANELRLINAYNARHTC